MATHGIEFAAKNVESMMMLFDWKQSIMNYTERILSGDFFITTSIMDSFEKRLQ